MHIHIVFLHAVSLPYPAAGIQVWETSYSFRTSSGRPSGMAAVKSSLPVAHRLRIVPALEVDHGQGLFQPGHLLLYLGPLLPEHLQPLAVGGRSLGTPGHELLDVLDLHTGLFQAFNDPQRLNGLLVEAAEAGALPLNVGQKSLLIVVPQGGGRQVKHPGHLSNGIIHKKFILSDETALDLKSALSIMISV